MLALNRYNIGDFTMRIIIEIDSKNELEKLSVLFKTLNISSIKIISDNITAKVKKGDKRIDPKGLFGIWANKPQTFENIRRDARKENIYRL